MRRTGLVLGIILLLSWAGSVQSTEKPIDELPKDAWDLAFVWIEPIRSAARESRRFDPVSGLWFGLLEGSVKSVERMATFLWPAEETDSDAPARPDKALLRYSF